MRLFPTLNSYRNYKRFIGELTKKYGNFPESFIRRRIRQIEFKNPRGFPQYQVKTLEKEDFYFGEHRPWSDEFRNENSIAKKARIVHVEPIRDWSFFKGDRVEILEGKDKGKQGIVNQVIQERNWVYVEGLNTKLKCDNKSKTSLGVYYQDEQPLLVTRDVALVDPSDLQPVGVEWRYTEEGERVRVSKRTGRIIPIPVQAEETLDYKTRGTYVGECQRSLILIIIISCDLAD
ncbi:probable 39S ribosomal protein L24, mitochondrial [Nilaparvata lugens]|uniref:probable 39S ribosomal protein L24, mitochondrial n=1 Tax=Nilaparvata lugens TaxID=108931 RepID=UPI00193E0B30|nr:probable 39S ribosomal protein L24, mitochondrial [Nilaparvata lugens]